LDTLATCIPLFASSDMYVAIGHVLIEIFKHVLAVWNTVQEGLVTRFGLPQLVFYSNSPFQALLSNDV
jgi:hypothetical protein